MGFRQNLGATWDCRFHNGYLEIDTPSKRKFKTTVTINTDWQCNMFTGTCVHFLVIEGEDLYVGLRDGSIIRTGLDGLLKALYTWEAPEERIIATVGYYNGRYGIREAKIDWAEPKLIHVAGVRKSFVLKAEYSALDVDLAEGTADDRLSESLRESILAGTGIAVMLKGGVLLDEQEHGYWRADKEISTVPTLQF